MMEQEHPFFTGVSADDAAAATKDEDDDDNDDNDDDVDGTTEPVEYLQKWSWQKIIGDA